ncbi:MAG: hypothetical protein KatS3mg062_0109 [Tepidiforma sp.]|nr:MAG: hypothetical protein KatS3mg062_0109 [Tepidiforma sp.]
MEQTLGRFASRADREVPAPLVFAGAAFDPAATVRDAVWDAFGGWQVLVPAITIVRRGERWSGWACAGDFPVSACEVPPDLGRAASTDLRAAVTQAVGEIRSGAYEKVVLAGSRVVPLGSTTPADVLERLCQAFPSCAVFSLRSGGLTWLGASPEPLARCEAGRAELVSLAGSRRRGRDAAEDLRLEQELLTSAKERWEHRLVVEAIASEAQDLLEEPCISATPEVMKLANIQHLRTPISGQLARGVSILDLVERLHPTPAVGGWPRVHALDAIRRLERMDRGWYAGPIGWVDAAGNGEFVVGLRTALLGSSEARLYAGAGIVADSDPAAELEEIETKLDALRGVIST